METNMLSEKVVQYVMTVTDEEFSGINVSNLALHFRIDRFTLSRQFKKHKNMTLDEFLSKEKMLRCVLLLLANKDITVKDVAERIGFCTSDYFIRAFRKFWGAVPGIFKDYKTPRSEVADRRIAQKSDRRKRDVKSKIPIEGDRRLRRKDRRSGSPDRRKQNSAHASVANPENNFIPALVPIHGQDESCNDCHYKLAARGNGDQ